MSKKQIINALHELLYNGIDLSVLPIVQRSGYKGDKNAITSMMFSNPIYNKSKYQNIRGNLK